MSPDAKRTYGLSLGPKSNKSKTEAHEIKNWSSRDQKTEAHGTRFTPFSFLSRCLQLVHPDVQGVQLQRPNMSFACTDCFGPHNIEKRITVKKAVKRYRSNNLKNDYESEEINSQDSEHYLQPHFTDGYIKRDDYLYITTGYLQGPKGFSVIHLSP